MSANPLRIGIQGVKASFHDVVARRFFGPRGEVVPVECSSFKLLCMALRDDVADFCVMAIENSIAGSILPNYSLLEQYGFKIIGEDYLRIEMCLLALPGQRVEDIRTVQSHPMALFQCEEFLASHPAMKVIEAADTAESAKLIAEKGLMRHAAIASRLAGETYGLEVLREGIETNKQNYTRFLAICRAEDYEPDPAADKASIRFEVGHRPGSLARVLEAFSRCGVNMTKIQSVPILGRPYQYSFHVDLEWQDRPGYERALELVRAQATNLIQFGEYRRQVGEYRRQERPGL